MLLRRREGARTGRALAVSLVLHAAAVGAMMAFSGPPRAPKEKVIAIDLVSAPPNVAGEKMAEPPATQEPAPAAPQPEPPSPEPQPAQPEPSPPEPAPPAPRPEPRREPPKEPEKAPEPRREPERPVQRPATPPAQRPSPPRPQPQTPARREPEKAAEKAKGPQSGQGSQPTRTQGQGTRTGPATGPAPRADAAGGEGLTVRTDGDPCPVQGYCDNVTRQVNRFFRPPAESGGASGEVCFRILRDGSVAEIETRNVRGDAVFRLQMREAAEAAGTRRAFGTLPSAFDPARWRWCVELSPRS